MDELAQLRGAHTGRSFLQLAGREPHWVRRGSSDCSFLCKPHNTLILLADRLQVHGSLAPLETAQMCGWIRGPLVTRLLQTAVKGAAENRFKADGRLDGAHATVLAMCWPVTWALLIRDRRNQLSLQAAGNREDLCVAGTQEAPLSSGFSSLTGLPSA